jgi:DNA-binding CsgD family transcriptional regulator
MECAGKIGISQATARTHLHRVFEKTGTKRQAELVRKVLAARPVVRRPE